MNFKEGDILALSDLFENLDDPSDPFYLSLEIGWNKDILLFFNTKEGWCIRRMLFDRVYKKLNGPSSYVFTEDYSISHKLTIALIQDKATLLDYSGNVLVSMPLSSFKETINRFNEVLQCQLNQN